MDLGRVDVPVAERGHDDAAAGEDVEEFRLVLEKRGEQGDQSGAELPEGRPRRNVGEEELAGRGGRTQHAVEPGQLLPAEAEIAVPVDVVHEDEAHVAAVEKEIPSPKKAREMRSPSSRTSWFPSMWRIGQGGSAMAFR